MNPEPAMSDEVSQFLEQVERLRGQQIEDEEMRAREREEFLAAKRERQARREGESLSCLVPFPIPYSRHAPCSQDKCYLARSRWWADLTFGGALLLWCSSVGAIEGLPPGHGLFTFCFLMDPTQLLLWGP